MARCNWYGLSCSMMRATKATTECIISTMQILDPPKTSKRSPSLMVQSMIQDGIQQGLRCVIIVSEYFMVVSGYMPAGSILFNRHGVQLYLISQHHVNTLNWSPCGQLVCLSGFGNLPGEMEIWDIKQLQLIGQCRKDKVIQFQWSPDSKYFTVATTFPRLRVNNMLQVYTPSITNIIDIFHCR